MVSAALAEQHSRLPRCHLKTVKMREVLQWTQKNFESIEELLAFATVIN